MSNKIKMVQVKLPASNNFLFSRITPLLKQGYKADSRTYSGECWIKYKQRLICSTEFDLGRHAKPNSFGELLVTLPSFVLKDNVEYTEV